jgi:hypothetical protein
MGSPEFEEALRLRAGSSGIKAPYGRVVAQRQPRARTVSLETRATATWNACSLGVFGVLRGARITNVPRHSYTAFDLVGLGLLCVPVLYVGGRSP